MLGPNGVGKSTIFNLVTSLFHQRRDQFYRRRKVNNFPIFLELPNLKLGIPQYGGYFYDLTFENLKAVGEILIKNQEIELKNKLLNF